MPQTVRVLAAAATVVATVVVAAGCGGSGGGGSDSAASSGDPALDRLVSAAKKEGQLTIYGAPPQEAADRVVDAFAKRYGIQAKYQRFVSSQLQQRYSAEASAGAPTADLVLVTKSPFLTDAERKGWLVGAGQADIPGYPPAGIRKSFLVPELHTALVQIGPNTIAFNTDEVPSGRAPKEWPDVLDPAYEGKVLLVDPRGSPAYIDFWWVIEHKYGLDYLRRLRGSVSRMYPSSVPMIEALAAGEGAIGIPALGPAVEPVKAQGAPVADTLPSATTGTEIALAISAKAAHPNAARLFARFVLGREGNTLLNQNQGVLIPAYGGTPLPAGYVSVDHAEAVKHQDEIYSALGVD